MNECAEYALFSRREMDRRYAGARARMAERKLDALLITGEENFQYFAGGSASLAPHYSLSRPNCLILPLDRDPVISTQTKDYITLATHMSEFREYFDVLRFPPRLLTRVVVGLGRIGSAVARRAKGFDMRVLAVRRRPERGAGPHVDATVADTTTGCWPRQISPCSRSQSPATRWLSSTTRPSR